MIMYLSAIFLQRAHRHCHITPHLCCLHKHIHTDLITSDPTEGDKITHAEPDMAHKPVSVLERHVIYFCLASLCSPHPPWGNLRCIQYTVRKINHNTIKKKYFFHFLMGMGLI